MNEYMEKKGFGCWAIKQGTRMSEWQGFVRRYTSGVVWGDEPNFDKMPKLLVVTII